MSKSTPVNQLPAFSSQQPSSALPSFVNDQQKHMVQQAQQASQTFQVPQNSNDVITPDDDNAIQDMLQSISATTSAMQQQEQISGVSSVPDVQLADVYHQTNLGFQQQQMPMQQQYDNPMMFMQGGADQNEQFNGAQDQQQIVANVGGSFAGGLLQWNTETKAALLACALFIGLSIAPIEQVIFKYVALYHIPYSTVLIKGVLCGVLLFLLLKLT